jgi:hypothetical protein
VSAVSGEALESAINSYRSKPVNEVIDHDMERALYFIGVSILGGPVRPYGHFACADAFSRDQARKKTIRELLLHGVLAQTTLQTRQMPVR